MKLKDVLKDTSKLNPKCERCGICCKAANCGFGKEDKNGKCIFLKNKNDLHSCELIEKGKVDPDKIGLNRGCVLRRDPKLFKQYKELYGEK
jgi:hypothetical protein